MDWQRIIEAGVLLFSMGWIFVLAPPLRRTSNFDFYAWTCVFGLGLISALAVAHHVQFALLEWSWFLLLVVTAVSTRKWGIRSQASLDNVLLHYALFAALTYLWWFWRINSSVYFEPPIPGLIRTVQFPGFSNIRFFSDYQSFILLLLPTALERLDSRPIARQTGTLLVSAYFALALLAGSRSLIVAHAVLHASLWLMLGRHYQKFLFSQLKFWVYGFVIFAILTMVIPLLMSQGTGDTPVSSKLIRTDSSQRTLLMGIAWDMIRNHPLLGVGPMHYADQANQNAAHPHNLFMQFAAEWGVPATILLSWLVGRDLLKRLNVLRHADSQGIPVDTSMAMTCAAIVLPIQAMFAGTLNYPVSQVLAVICFAYPVMGLTNGDEEKTEGLNLVGLTAMLLVIMNLTTLQSIRDRNLCFIQTHWPTNHFAPRFWQQGWLVGECGPGRPTVEISPGVLQQIPGRSPVQAGEP